MTKKKSKRIIKILLLVGIIVSLFYIPWPIVKAWIAPLPKTIQQQVNKAMDYGFDGIIVYVDEKGKQPLFYTSGYNNRKNKTLAVPHSLFKIASVDKLYTAVAIAKLVNEGHLCLPPSLGQ